jgi:hypothetical protein
LLNVLLQLANKNGIQNKKEKKTLQARVSIYTGLFGDLQKLKRDDGV